MDKVCENRFGGVSKRKKEKKLQMGRGGIVPKTEQVRKKEKV